MESTGAPQPAKPTSIRDRLVSLMLAAGLAGLGVFMILRPDYRHGPAEGSRGRTKLLVAVLDWIWSVPAGVILVLIGLLFLWGALSRLGGQKSGPAA